MRMRRDVFDLLDPSSTRATRKCVCDFQPGVSQENAGGFLLIFLVFFSFLNTYFSYCFLFSRSALADCPTHPQLSFVPCFLGRSATSYTLEPVATVTDVTHQRGDLPREGKTSKIMSV